MNPLTWCSRALVCVLVGLLVLSVPVTANADQAIVRIVFFYHPSCPHCHMVMDEILPALASHYGDQLRIVSIDISTSEGEALFHAYVNQYRPSMVGVPVVLIGDHVLIGSRDIPTELPGLIDDALQQGGTDWPDLPGMAEAVRSLEGGNGAVDRDWRARFLQDPVGNTLSTLVLVGLTVVLILVIKPRGWQEALAKRVGAGGLFLVLLVGLGAASYLAHVETTGSAAVCGPVGDCNAVQQSQYAMLFGMVPVAVLGVLGYLALLGTTVLAVWGRATVRTYASALRLLMALFGLAFSIYLTFLEPFVIGATCAWCLTSAICMALSALFSAGPGWSSLRAMARRPVSRQAAGS